MPHSGRQAMSSGVDTLSVPGRCATLCTHHEDAAFLMTASNAYAVQVVPL